MLRLEANLSAALGGTRARVRSAWQPVALVALAAALAWLFAHRVLGHSQPFFAPIAAAISLSTSRIQRSRRIVQMVVGVLLGIGVAEVLAAALGTSTAALALIVFVTMTIAVLAGAGFFGQGMMFANQAAASAILVVTLHRHGTGSERAIDAVVGGAAALVLGVLMFPAEPLSMLRDAERAVLASLVAALRRIPEVRSGGERSDGEWTLEVGYTVHQRLAELARARSTARANVRIAPRRWSLRAPVDAEIDRLGRLDLLANTVLGLVRAATAEADPLPQTLQHHLEELTRGLARLAESEQPWPTEVREDVEAIARRASDYARQASGEGAATTSAILGAAATDLLRVLIVPAEAEPIHRGPVSGRVSTGERRSSLPRRLQRPSRRS